MTPQPEPTPTPGPGLFLGIEHVGVTVPDIETATKFFQAAFDAEVVYEGLGYGGPPVEGPQLEHLLNVPPGTKIRGQRLLRIGSGANIELFQMDALHHRAAARPSDYGVQHFGVYTHDIAGATAQFERAGGTLLGPPGQSTFAAEAALDFKFCYGITPWGQTVEMISYSHMPYETRTAARRWHP